MPDTEKIADELFQALRKGLNLMAQSDKPKVRQAAIDMLVGKQGCEMSVTNYRTQALIALSEPKWIPEERAVLVAPLTPNCWPAIYRRGYRQSGQRYTVQQLVAFEPRWKSRLEWAATARGMSQAAYIRHLVEQDYGMLSATLRAGLKDLPSDTDTSIDGSV